MRSVVVSTTKMMDAKAAVREAMMAERQAGHWADPSVDDDRHDEQSLFGRGEDGDENDGGLGLTPDHPQSASLPAPASGGWRGAAEDGWHIRLRFHQRGGRERGTAASYDTGVCDDSRYT